MGKRTAEAHADYKFVGAFAGPGLIVRSSDRVGTYGTNQRPVKWRDTYTAEDLKSDP